MSYDPIHSRPVRVLVVEDIVDIAESLAAFLKVNGCDVRTAYSGGDALEVVDTFVPDAVILDVGLQDMDGVTLGNLLRDMPELRNVTLIAYSAYTPDQAAEQSQAVWVFDDYFMKPADPDRLIRAIRSRVAI